MNPLSLRSAQDLRSRAKIARLEQARSPRVLDLFAGCGGLSLGLQRAGFEIMAGLDADSHASASHALNFHAGCPRHAMPLDLTDPDVTPKGICDRLGLGAPEDTVDVVVGRPALPSLRADRSGQAPGHRR